MKKILKSMVLALLVSFTLTPAAHAGSEPFVGEIRIFAGNFAPRGWMFCRGQILSAQDNQKLYFVLGDLYGGDGSTTFALPDLRDKGILPNSNTANGQYIIATQGDFPERS
jgi:microcystin-dependent protein